MTFYPSVPKTCQNIILVVIFMIIGFSPSLAEAEDQTRIPAIQDFDQVSVPQPSPVITERTLSTRSRMFKGLVLRADRQYRDGLYSQALETLDGIFIYEPMHPEAQALRAEIENLLTKQQRTGKVQKPRSNGAWLRSADEEPAPKKAQTKRTKKRFRLFSLGHEKDLPPGEFTVQPARAKTAPSPNTTIVREQQVAVPVTPVPAQEAAATITTAPVVPAESVPDVSGPESSQQTGEMTKDEALELAMQELLAGKQEPAPETAAAAGSQIAVFDIDDKTTAATEKEKPYVERQVNNEQKTVKKKRSLFGFLFDHKKKKAAAPEKKVSSREREQSEKTTQGVTDAVSSAGTGEQLVTASSDEKPKKSKDIEKKKQKKQKKERSSKKKRSRKTQGDPRLATMLSEAKSLYKEKEYEAAIAKYEAALAIDPANQKASEGIDRAREKMIVHGEYEADLKQKSAEKNVREKVEFYTQVAESLHEKGKYDSAIVMIQKGLMLDPDNERLKKLKETNDAWFAERAQVAPEESADAAAQQKALYINRGVKEFLIGNYDKATEAFQKVLEIDPNDEKARASIMKIQQKTAGN